MRRAYLCLIAVMLVLLPGATMARGDGPKQGTEMSGEAAPLTVAWVIQTIDSGIDVGKGTSIGLDPRDWPHIAYYDAKNGDLKHAWRNDPSGTWQLETVDSTGTVGQNPSIAVYHAMWPAHIHVAYYDATNGNLKHAYYSLGSWNVETVDSTGNVGQNPSVAIGNGSDLVRISYYDATNGDLKFAYYDGGAWTVETVASEGDVGQYSSLDCNDSDTECMIAYYYSSPTAGDHLEVARGPVGGAWSFETVDSTGDVGEYCSLDYSSPNDWQIAYYDATNKDLKYAESLGGGAWSVATWDDVGNVGEYTGMSAYSGASYYDNSNTALKFRWHSGSAETVDNTGSVGTYTSCTKRVGIIEPHISYYDSTNGNLKFAYLCTLPTAGFSHTPEPACVETSVWFNNSSTGSRTLKSVWAFGDGGTSQERDPNHVYTDTGVYNVSLTVTNECGTDNASEPVTIYGVPQPGFLYAPQPPCAGSEVNFVNTSEYSGSATFLWDFGDGITSTLENPAHLYADTGAYEVSLAVTNMCATEVYTETLLVYGDPVAGFLWGPSPACLGAKVSFTNTSVASGTLTYNWDFGDGTGSIYEHPTHSYDMLGDHVVVMTATNECSDDTATGVVAVYTTAVASFMWEPQLIVVGQVATFTAEVSSTLPVSLNWDFGDGFTETGQIVRHVYDEDGTYSVTLTATNDCGQVAYTATVEVCNPVQGAGFSWEPPVPVVGSPVTFTAAATGTPPLTYTWDFGDGSGGQGLIVIHTYADGGDYLTTLTVTNECGQEVVTGTVGICAPVQGADFTWEPDPPGIGGVVYFTGTVLSGTQPLYEWEFGDGGTAQGSVVSHTYAATGTYTVEMTASNDCGQEMASAEVEVVDRPTAAFDTNSPVCLGDSMLFTNMSGGTPPLTYLWDFDDGFTSAEENPSHTYANGGTYTVVLSVSNPFGQDQTSRQVEVRDPVMWGDFSWEPPSPDPGQIVTFTAQTDGSEPVTYEWDMGDGFTATGQVITHVYAVTDTYTVTMQAYNNCPGDAVVSYPVPVSFCAAPFGLSQEHSPVVPMVGQVATFTATLQAGDLPVTFAWDFGDGSSFEYGRVVQHTYVAPDTYTVTVAAWNDCGGPVYAAEQVQVQGQTSWIIYLPLVIKSFYGGDAFEEDDTPETAKQLSLNTSQQRDFAPEGDVDWAYLDLQAGVEYYIQAHLLAEGVDTYLYLYAEGDYGNPLSENDDCGYPPPDNLASCITFTPTASGRYYLKVTNHSGVWGQGASYILELEQH